jgi:hypothetical protein
MYFWILCVLALALLNLPKQVVILAVVIVAGPRVNLCVYRALVAALWAWGSPWCAYRLWLWPIWFAWFPVLVVLLAVVDEYTTHIQAFASSVVVSCQWDSTVRAGSKVTVTLFTQCGSGQTTVELLPRCLCLSVRLPYYSRVYIQFMLYASWDCCGTSVVVLLL